MLPAGPYKPIVELGGRAVGAEGGAVGAEGGATGAGGGASSLRSAAPRRPTLSPRTRSAPAPLDPLACRPFPACPAQPNPEVGFAYSVEVRLCPSLARWW